MNNYLARLALTSDGITISYGSKNDNPVESTAFNWSYAFRDGSSLVGYVDGQLDRDKKMLLNPSNISANYIDVDGKTVLVSWTNKDFVSFETTLDNTDILIVASNDNFVANSLCLVSSATRSRAQVTEQGVQLVAESLKPNTWSLIPVTSFVSAPESGIGFDWSFSSLFPFFAISLNCWLPSPRLMYQWTFLPFLPLYPFLRVMRTTSNSDELVNKASFNSKQPKLA